MSNYVGIHTQIARNNRLSTFYLLGFPLLILFPVFGISVFYFYGVASDPQAYGISGPVNIWSDSFTMFLSYAPTVLLLVGIWFMIAFLSHSNIIKIATKSDTLSRKENPRIYNLTENLCMSVGMQMPKLHIIETPALNAFASGISEKSYTVTLTRGIIDTLNDDELEGVIAHELMHIRNKDVRLLIISIVFVGILSFLAQILFRMFIRSSARGGKKDKNAGAIMLVALVLVAISYLLSILFKFGLSRKREYMADAGAADMTKKPEALAKALRKISGNHDLSFVNDDLKQLFIANDPAKNKENTSMSLSSLFKTHPPIEKRIAVLEGF
jgi:heat shock protein HtpX